MGQVLYIPIFTLHLTCTQAWIFTPLIILQKALSPSQALFKHLSVNVHSVFLSYIALVKVCVCGGGGGSFVIAPANQPSASSDGESEQDFPEQALAQW